MKRRTFLSILATIPFINPEEVFEKMPKGLIANLPEDTIIKNFTFWIPRKKCTNTFLNHFRHRVPDIITIEVFDDVYKCPDLAVIGVVPFTEKNGFKTDADLEECVGNIYDEVC